MALLEKSERIRTESKSQVGLARKLNLLSMQISMYHWKTTRSISVYIFIRKSLNSQKEIFHAFSFYADSVRHSLQETLEVECHLLKLLAITVLSLTLAFSLLSLSDIIVV